MAKLTVIEGTAPATFAIEPGETIVGRHPDSGLHIPCNAVSGTHARLILQNGGCQVEDLGSRNGTYVNNQQINQRVPLNHGDQIHFGPVHLHFDNPGAAPAPAAEPSFGSSAPLPPEPFSVAVTSDAEDDATIMGAVSAAGRYGVLETQPEAKLKAVLEISSALAGTVDPDSLLPKILDTLFGIFPSADRACILVREEDGEMKPRAMKHRREGEDATVRLSRTVVNKVLEEKTGILSADAASDFSASQSIADLSIRSMMCVPLLGLDETPLGILNIDSQNPLGQFKEEDLDLLMSVAGQAALSFESARLLSSYIDKQKQDGELDIARDIQRALLPEELPSGEGWEFYASYDSAQAVGGDYYDAFELGEGRICLAFGDVAGKGVPCALIMSRMSSCVQSTMKFTQDAEEATMAINEHMCDSAVEGRFVTFVLVIIDLNTCEMQLVNAGHMSPVIRLVDGSTAEFDEELVGPPIGIVEEYPYEVDKRIIQPGETIVIYTDGVDEAMNHESELYGHDRLIEFIKKSSPNASELGRTLFADVRLHANGRAQNDDITIMTIGRNAE